MTKNLFTFLAIGLLVVVSIFLTASTQDGSKDGNAAMLANPEFTVSVQDTISQSRFNTWKTNWATNGQAYTANTLVTAFTMPVVDLTEVLGEQPTQVRYYLGLEKLGTNIYEPHIMLVGVDANGQDMIDYANGKYVYDVTCPCPPVCNQLCTPRNEM